jgi:hypothetical protein
MPGMRSCSRKERPSLPDRAPKLGLNRVGAAALAGAFTGAVSGALTALLDHDAAGGHATPEPAQLRAQVRQQQSWHCGAWRR